MAKAGKLAMAAAAALTEDLVEEVLLRFPPDDPATLVRAALVSKPWCRLICGRGFRRRFRRFHGAPPLLGLVCHYDRRHAFEGLFIPVSSSFRPRDHPDHRNLKPVHSCHGRVLLHRKMARDDDLFIWNPIKDNWRKLPRWPLYSRSLFPACNAAVFCAGAVVGDGCSHLDCHFMVVFVGIDLDDGRAFICVYSSDVNSWSEPIYDHRRHYYNDLEKGNSVLIGSDVYFKCLTVSIHQPLILKYDLLTQEIYPIHIPKVGILEQIVNPEHIELMPMEDGRLGFVGMRNRFTVSLWSRMEHGRKDEDARWAQSRVIEVDNLRLHKNMQWTIVVAFADTGAGRVIFIWSCDRLFSLNLNLGSYKAVRESFGVCGVVPYVSFCTPALGAVSIDEGPGVGVTSA